MKTIAVDSREYHGTALIAPDDSVWITVSLHWWELSTLLWWWLAPSNRKAWVLLNVSGDRKFRSRAICIARRHVRIGRAPETSETAEQQEEP